MNINTANLKGKALTVTNRMADHVSAYRKSKVDGRSPERVAVTKDQYETLMKTFPDKAQPESMEYFGIKVEIA